MKNHKPLEAKNSIRISSCSIPDLSILHDSTLPEIKTGIKYSGPPHPHLHKRVADNKHHTDMSTLQLISYNKNIL